MPFNIGPGELIIVLIIALLIIGPGKLPDVGAALGKSIREFRKASSDVEDATRIDTTPLPNTLRTPPTPPANATAEATATPAASTAPTSEPTTESHP